MATMQSKTVTAEQKRIYDDFARYPWESDTVFQAGLNNILKELSREQEENSSLIPDDNSEEGLKEFRLLQAKHFYYTRFKQDFSLAGFLDYQRNGDQQYKVRDENDELFQRVDKYAYDDDPKYMSGLPTIINGWVERQLTEKSSPWDKDKMDEEFAKAKAFYYSSFIEPIKIAEYLRWRKRKETEAQPACPFANLWKNKKKVEPTGQPNVSGAKRSFVIVERPKTFGPQTLILCFPKTSNVLTSNRIKELGDAVAAADKENNVTSSLLTVTVAENIDGDAHHQQQQGSNVIHIKDTKVLTSGIAYSATVSNMDEDKGEIGAAVHSLDKLAGDYYGLVRQLLFQRTKPIITFLNGAVPLDSSYLAFWHKFVRVATENTLLNLGINLSHAPVPPLLLLSLCRARKPLPQGLELFMALAPRSLARLRGPELLRLGLVDAFVPEAKLNDMFKDCQRMALCPLPNTELALRMALAADHTYPGPDRLGVWENEIQQVFGNVDSFEDLVKRLEGMDNRWSKDILSHWRTLPPKLLKTVFQAVKDSFEIKPLEMLQLEESLNQKWRSSQDYRLWRQGKSSSWEGSTLDHPELETYYNETVSAPADEDEDVFVYEIGPEIEQEDQEQDSAVVCPITGQKGSVTSCPVSGRKTAGTED